MLIPNKPRLYRYLLSLVFGVIIVFHFYLIRWAVPKNIPIYDEIVISIFIVFSILVLFPIRSKVLAYLLQKDDYTLLVGGDFSDLDFAERSLDMRSLLREDFPDFIDWLQLSSGSIAVMDVKRKSYHVYLYRKRKLVSEQNINRKAYDKLCSFLAKSSQSISINHTSLPKEVETQMKSLNAHTIHPLLYRSIVLGFLILHEPPRTPYTERTLEIFKHKAVLSVQNYILSHRVIDSRIYDREFQTAERVQKALENTAEPELSAFNIERLHGGTPPLIFEFFRLGQKKMLFMIIICETFSGSIGLFVYSILGRLYSFIHLRKRITLESLLKHIDKSQDWPRNLPSIKILFLELNEKTKRLSFSRAEEFEIDLETKDLAPERIPLTNEGGNLRLSAQTKVQILYRSAPFLQITPKKNGRKQKR